MIWIQSIAGDIYKSLFAERRWRFYLEGTGNTLLMALMATCLGIFIGMIIALIKVTYQQTGKLKWLNKLANLYTTIIRGTPVLLQLLIFYTIIFKAAPVGAAIAVAALAFGINSGAYVSEIFRAGIVSIDKGQTEAGRSLGLNQKQTMRLIVLPQAIKNILPALFNEFISLLKETSVAGYIAVVDITRAGDIIRSRTWTLSPLFIAAAIYLCLVLGLTKIQQRLERRLSAGDMR
ncbi:amino acid ABC transporter permease [Oscillospiraceae bacterium MB08-C2-2]|nr:amino acid ABC transporter permease [Oscillospiraceae bacterium MB08-C2-2]